MNKKVLYALSLLCIILLIVVIGFYIDIINTKKDNYYKELEDSMKVLTVELNNSCLKIIKGNKFNIDYNKEYFDIITDNHKVEIKELNNHKSNLEITVPQNFNFDQLYIKGNEGNIQIDNITTEFFLIDSKLGNVTINNLNVTNKTDLFVNSSKMKINDADIHNMDLFMADGAFSYNGLLNGKNEINTSDSEINFHLKDNLDEYKIEINEDNKNIRVNNKIINNKSYTKGKKIIIINGKGKLNINSGA